MQDTSGIKYRIKFSKNGAVRYTGHLDVMRYFQRVIKRAQLPVKYSEGFSPHQLLSFAFPLSVGYTSDGEYFDMVMTEKVNESYIKDAMNNQSDTGIKVIAVKQLDSKERNCMACVFAASYNITIKDKIVLPDNFKEKAVDYLSQATIPVNKPKKKGGGFTQMDLKRYLYDYRFVDDRTVYICVNAGSETNINPAFVMREICNDQNIDLDDNPFFIHRVDIFQNDSDDDNAILRALI